MPGIEEVVKRIAAAALGEEGWSVARPEGGWSTTTYVAERADRRVVVKLEDGRTSGVASQRSVSAPL